MQGPFYKFEGYLAIKPLKEFMSECGNKFGGNILDAGCGNMPYRKYFTKAAEYVGIDHARFPNFRETDLVGDLAELPFDDGRFDVALNNQVLEYVMDPKKVLMEICRVLAPGGILIISVPQMCRLHGEPHDYWRFTKHGLNLILENAGFSLISCEPMGGYWRAAGSHLNFYLREHIKNGFLLIVVRQTIIRANNLVFSLLDRVFPWSKDTLGYMAVAKKES